MLTLASNNENQKTTFEVNPGVPYVNRGLVPYVYTLLLYTQYMSTNIHATSVCPEIFPQRAYKQLTEGSGQSMRL